MTYYCYYCNRPFDAIPKLEKEISKLGSYKFIECSVCDTGYSIEPKSTEWEIKSISFTIKNEYLFLISIGSKNAILYTLSDDERLTVVLRVPVNKILHLSKDRLINKIKTIMVFS